MTSELLVYNYGMSTIAELITSKFLVYNYCNYTCDSCKRKACLDLERFVGLRVQLLQVAFLFIKFINNTF